MSGPRDERFTRNNFDLIRLVAATEVALTHSGYHFGVESPWLAPLRYIPGVPIFFFISGFLIYRSYANIGTDRLRVFFTNRVLRLYPGLWVCFLLSLGVLWITGFLATMQASASQFGAWVIAQLSLFQFYNPDFLRSFGTGVLNGSLWTISVELQFYLLTPLLFALCGRHAWRWITLIVLFAACNAWNTHLNPKLSLPGKLFNVSFLPWFAMFLLGAFLSTRQALQEKLLRVPLLAWVAIYLVLYQASMLLGAGVGNGINIVAYLALAALVFRAAYAMPDLAGRLLRRNDISYGMYIYHMPIINLLLVMGWFTPAGSFAVAIAATVVVSCLSWVLVERPALRLKRVTLRRPG